MTPQRASSPDPSSEVSGVSEASAGTAGPPNGRAPSGSPSDNPHATVGGPAPGSRERSAKPAVRRGQAARREVSEFRQRVRATLRVLRSNPTGRITLRVIVAVAGAVVVAAGIALIPLPGPGWLIVIGGLAIWAVEFVWARHLLQFTRSRVRQWTRWVGRQPLLVRLGLGLLGLIFVAVVAWLSLKYSFGIDIGAKIWNYITTH